MLMFKMDTAVACSEFIAHSGWSVEKGLPAAVGRRSALGLTVYGVYLDPGLWADR